MKPSDREHLESLIANEGACHIVSISSCSKCEILRYKHHKRCQKSHAFAVAKKLLGEGGDYGICDSIW